MNKRQYLKMSLEAYDYFKKRLYPGDTVIINNYYNDTIIIGTISHFTESGKVVIKELRNIGYREIEYIYYRRPSKCVKLKNGHKHTNKN